MCDGFDLVCEALRIAPLHKNGMCVFERLSSFGRDSEMSANTGTWLAQADTLRWQRCKCVPNKGQQVRTQQMPALDPQCPDRCCYRFLFPVLPQTAPSPPPPPHTHTIQHSAPRLLQADLPHDVGLRRVREQLAQQTGPGSLHCWHAAQNFDTSDPRFIAGMLPMLHCWRAAHGCSDTAVCGPRTPRTQAHAPPRGCRAEMATGETIRLLLMATTLNPTAVSTRGPGRLRQSTGPALTYCGGNRIPISVAICAQVL